MIREIIALIVAAFFRLTSPIFLKFNRVKTSGRIRLSGFPLIKNKGHITLGAGSDFRSLSSFTALGVPNPCILNSLSSCSEIIIGKNCGLSGAVICAQKSVSIGDRVQVGSGAIICDTDFHSQDYHHWRTASDLENARVAPVVIGNDCFIGARVIVLKGVTVGEKSIIGAGSIVVKDIPPNSMVAGNPAKVISQIR